MSFNALAGSYHMDQYFHLGARHPQDIQTAPLAPFFTLVAPTASGPALQVTRQAREIRTRHIAEHLRVAVLGSPRRGVDSMQRMLG
jgi:hypothetical protein